MRIVAQTPERSLLDDWPVSGMPSFHLANEGGSRMRLRLVFLFLVSLGFASMAGAACLVCVGEGWNDEGTCQPAWGVCQGWCCLLDPGQWCTTGERIWGCSEEPSIMPTAYFSTRLPLQTEGSTLRLQLGKGVKPMQRRCTGAEFAMMAKERRS
jgi:hypothetical protein